MPAGNQTPKTRPPSLTQLRKLIEDLFAQLAADEQVELRRSLLPAAKPAEIDEFEKRFGLALPAEVGALWRRGLQHGQGSVSSNEEDAAFIGFDLLAPKLVARDLSSFRELATGAALRQKVPR